MSFVAAQPEFMTAVAGNLQSIGSLMNAQNASAQGATLNLAPAAVDEISCLTAMQFTLQAAIYQAAASQAAEIHTMITATLAANAASYATAEYANVADLR